MVDVKFDESNGSQVEQLPIDVGDKDPLEAIQDLSIGKVRPTEVKESTLVHPSGSFYLTTR